MKHVTWPGVHRTRHFCRCHLCSRQHRRHRQVFSCRRRPPSASFCRGVSASAPGHWQTASCVLVASALTHSGPVRTTASPRRTETRLAPGNNRERFSCLHCHYLYSHIYIYIYITLHSSSQRQAGRRMLPPKHACIHVCMLGQTYNPKHNAYDPTRWAEVSK